MTARNLDAVFGEAPPVPLCPAACPFRELCPDYAQQVAAAQFTAGLFKRPEDCWRWHHLADLVRRDLGIEPPATAAALNEAMGRPRRRLREPGE